MAGDGLLPVKLFQDGTNAKFKARVSIGPTFPIVNPGSETPLFRVAPGVQLVFLAIQVNEPDGKTVMEVVKQSCRVATDSQGIRSLVPTKSSTEHAGSKVIAEWQDRFHPRLSVGAESGHEFPFLVVDFTFVQAVNRRQHPFRDETAGSVDWGAQADFLFRETDAEIDRARSFWLAS